MTKMRRQLIFVWNYVEWGGAQIYLLAIMKAAKADHDIVVILPRLSMPDIINYLEAHEIRYILRDTFLDNRSATTISGRLRRQWRRIHAEISTFWYLRRYNLSQSILHIETAPWQSWILLTALALRRSHIFVTMHNFLPAASKLRMFIWKARLQLVSRLPRFHIFPSNLDTKNKLKGWVSDKFWAKMHVTYTAINPDEIAEATHDKLSVAAMRQHYEINENSFLVLCVGQFIDRKGRWIFLDAAKIVLAGDPNVEFAWLTPAMPDETDVVRIKSYDLDDKFHLILSESVGKEHVDVLKFFRIADIFALASYVEGLPIALLEAMAMGLPCISTNVYAIPEAIKQDETGILIEAGDSRALADAILRLKRGADLRKQLSISGRDHVLEHFDERVVAETILTSYYASFGDR